jgi:hypothetical protein
MKIFKPSTLVSLGIAIAAALVTQPAIAIVQTLVITENNSTASGLTAMLTVGTTTTSLTVTNNPNNPGTDDQWFIALPGVTGGIAAFQNWTEPGAAGVLNVVQFAVATPNELFVRSDFDSGFTGGLADGTADTTTFRLNEVELDVTFIDKGDVASAPDTGSTLGLLSLSVVALLGATRLRFLQPAA